MAGTHNGELLVRVRSEPMVQHLRERVVHHQLRATILGAESEVEDRKAEEELARGETVTDRMSIKSSSNYTNAVSHRDRLRQRAQEHAVQATTMQFVLDHLVEDSFYDLRRSELVVLELVPAGRF